jgi:hypothetical protein
MTSSDAAPPGGLEEGELSQVIALHATALLAESLKSSLRSERLVIRGLATCLADPEAVCDLVIVEQRDNEDALIKDLSNNERFAATPLLWIGPTDSSLLQGRPQVTELSADVSVSEVLRLIRQLLFGARPIAASPASSHQATVSVSPRASDPGPAHPSASNNPSPAPLLPGTGSPGSGPSSGSRRMPTIPPALAGRPSDELSAPPSELSAELLELLNEAEQRVAEELRPRQSAAISQPDADRVLVLSPEVEAALADPIGEDLATGEGGNSSDGDAGAFDRRQSSEPGRTGSRAAGTGTAPEPLAEGRRTSHPPTRALAPSRNDSAHPADSTTTPPLQKPPQEVPLAPTSAIDPRLTATVRPVPSPQKDQMEEPTRGTLPAPLPPDPGVPRDEWVGRTLGGPSSDRRPAEPSRPTQISDASHSPEPRLSTRQHTISPDLRAGLVIEAAPSRESQHTLTTTGLSLPPETTRPPTRDADGPLPSSANWTPSEHATEDGAEPAAQRVMSPSPQPQRETNPPPPRESSPPPPATPRAGAVHQKTQTGIFGSQQTLKGDLAVHVVAQAISTRQTGVLEFETEGRIRRVVLRDGDLVTAASSASEESLLAHLIQRGDLAPQIGEQLGHRVASFGRHAGAALIAAGHLPQDQLWPVLRSHAEFVVAKVLAITQGVAAFEESVPERLQAEPSVFGGATGSEVFVELLRRVLPPEDAVARLGGASTRLRESASYGLIEECALSPTTLSALERALNTSLGDALAEAPDPEFPCVLYALVQLEVLRAERAALGSRATSPARGDALDEQALRLAIRSRRALVEDGDYFALLGVPHNATGYDIRRAYLEIRRHLDPSVVLTPATVDLADDVELILEVVTEAYEILREQTTRDRYRRAIESVPA